MPKSNGEKPLDDNNLTAGHLNYRNARAFLALSHEDMYELARQWYATHLTVDQARADCREMHAGIASGAFAMPDYVKVLVDKAREQSSNARVFFKLETAVNRELLAA
ncbi:MAG: hypothetical protein AB202_03405 [Parcubacteria bacterium C7867-007]|nr:MAG: hypothetical protein AB202_03405 [Parcubacteria bacterium C7867-007]